MVECRHQCQPTLGSGQALCRSVTSPAQINDAISALPTVPAQCPKYIHSPPYRAKCHLHPGTCIVPLTLTVHGQEQQHR
ncbi:hypothetical protein Hamer_G026155 [Homarus americanus]|uniref:Uncharacterized protein n=1 Tax=Homarus americanus TaxID=6706 RepID=A0A8J5MZM9_HOMAM|nr:hypothetical protein Hamer_G026155 [Homarus americanus]